MEPNKPPVVMLAKTGVRGGPGPQPSENLAKTAYFTRQKQHMPVIASPPPRTLLKCLFTQRPLLRPKADHTRESIAQLWFRKYIVISRP